MEDIIELTVGNYFHGIQTDSKTIFIKCQFYFFNLFYASYEEL